MIMQAVRRPMHVLNLISVDRVRLEISEIRETLGLNRPQLKFRPDGAPSKGDQIGPADRVSPTVVWDKTKNK